jgi:hypothetical protein
MPRQNAGDQSGVVFRQELGNWPLGLDCALLLRRKAGSMVRAYLRWRYR